MTERSSFPWLSTHLQYVNLRFTQFGEFLHHHLHFETWWISSRGHMINASFKLLFLRKFSWGRCKSPQGSTAKHTWCGWLWDAHVASSASSSSKLALPVTGMPWDNQEVCTKPAPHLAFTVLGNTINASLWSSSRHDVGCWGIGISCTLLCCSFTLSRIACCFSSRVERCLILLYWDLISFSDIDVAEIKLIHGSDEPSPSQLYQPIKLLSLKGLVLLWIPVLMRPFSELTPVVILEPSQCYVPVLFYITQWKCLQGTGLGGTGPWLLRFIMAYCRCISIMYLVLCQNWEFFVMKGWILSQIPTQLSTHNVTQKLMVSVMNELVTN